MSDLAAPNIHALVAYLGGDEHHRVVEEMLINVEGMTDAERREVSDDIAERAASIRQSLLDLIIEDDISEAMLVLPFIWLEKRFEWMRLNAQMQYQTVFQGTAQPALMARGAALSFLLSVFEQYLTPETAFFVTKIAADPLAVARAEMMRNERLFETLEAASRGGRGAVDAIMKASETVARISEDERIFAALADASATVTEEVGRNLQISLNDFYIAVEADLSPLLADSPVHITLEPLHGDAAASFPAAVARGVRNLLRKYLRMQVQSVGSASERLRTGRKANLSLALSAEVLRDEFSLVLTDDGDGEREFVLTPPEATLREMHVTHERTAGVGSRLTVRCGIRSVQEYLIVRVGEVAHDDAIAIQLSAVERMLHAGPETLSAHGRALRTTEEDDGVIPIVDLGQQLFDAKVIPDDGVYVIVRIEDGASFRRLALRVRELDGVSRGQVRYVPDHAQTESLRGFLMDRRKLVGVLDIERLAA